MEALVILAELASVSEGITNAVKIVEAVRTLGHTHLTGAEVDKVRAAIAAGYPARSVFDEPGDFLRESEPGGAG